MGAARAAYSLGPRHLAKCILNFSERDRANHSGAFVADDISAAFANMDCQAPTVVRPSDSWGMIGCSFLFMGGVVALRLMLLHDSRRTCIASWSSLSAMNREFEDDCPASTPRIQTIQTGPHLGRTADLEDDCRASVVSGNGCLSAHLVAP